LPECTQSFYQEESALPQFHENSDEVPNLVDKRPISESFGSLILQDRPATVTNSGRPVQSAKQDASSQVSKRAKLKSVKSLRVDTGRNRDRGSTLSYTFQREDQNDIAVCSQNCGTECAACIALFGISECVGSYRKEEVITEEKVHMNPPASIITMEGNKKEQINPENYIRQESFDEKSEKSLGLLHPAELSEPVSENTSDPGVKLNGSTTANLEGRIFNNESMSPCKIAEGPEDLQLEGTTYWNLFGNLDTIGFQGNEENSPLDKENITPYVSGNIIMERINTGVKPIISAELMDSISPLHLEHDICLEKENSMLNTGNGVKSNDPTSENLSSLISANTKLHQNQTAFMPDILLDRESSELPPGKYDAISPGRQEGLFSDKENVTPPSTDRKPSVRRVLGSRMDDSVPAEKTSNMGIHKWECNELSAISKDFHTADDDVFYSDMENLTPIASRGVVITRKCLPKNLTVDADQDQEAFFSDMENLTPLSSAARKTRDMSENRARIESVIAKKRFADRLPFQTLVSNSPLRPTSSVGCDCAVARDLRVKLEDELDKVCVSYCKYFCFILMVTIFMLIWNLT
jgi:hypothetical protein